MYIIEFEEGFEISYKKIIKGNSVLEKKLEKTLLFLKANPRYPSLKSHKVDTIEHKNVWVSWVTGDIRLVWYYNDEKELIITCIQVGTHSDANQIYNRKSS